MTPFTEWEPGAELGCSACLFQTSGQDGSLGCQIAMELALFGEALTATACPSSLQEQAA